MKILNILTLFFLFYLYGCVENPPVAVDGNGKVILKAVWDKSIDSIPDIVPLQNAKVIMNSQYGMMVYYTDANGILSLSHLPQAVYSISVRAPHPADPSIILVGALRDINVISDQTCSPLITAKPVSNSGIAINELYVGGPVNNLFYFYDLFVELYNSSDSIKYLDGMMVMRVSGNGPGSTPPGTKGPGADEYGDGRIWGATYAYKFPGNPGEKNYPFFPKQFLVLAGDAVDHRKTVSTSIDLSRADWEFYNQFMPADIDNPAVPNLINLKPENLTKFLLNLVGDVVIVSSGKDSVWTDGIDIATIIDAVQYASTSTKLKTIDDRLDRGLVISPPRYSGQCMQRKEPGMDTNDGSLDWGILTSPTPGRH